MMSFTSRQKYYCIRIGSCKQPTPCGPIPHNMAQTFDGPPTLERSGSERRGGAVSSLFPEGERVGVRGGALFNGKEGRGDFRKNLLPLRIFVQITLIIMCFMMCVRKQIA